MSGSRSRLDELCVRLGLFPDTEKAERAIMAGEVYLGDEPIYSRARLVYDDADIHIKSSLPFVSRGGEKLEKALRVFSFDPEGLACLDCGASTGGFTDCLLKHGAASVCAVDVGYGQFAWSLRKDTRVKLFERTNINALDAFEAGAPFDLAVADISFAPLHSYLGSVRSLLRDDGAFIGLVKPQFEAHRSQVGVGGIVHDPEVHREVVSAALQTCEECGMTPCGLDFSPIRGAKGNVEFLMLAICCADPVALDVAEVVDAAHNALDK